MTNGVDGNALRQPAVLVCNTDSTRLWIEWQLNQFFSLATETLSANSHSKYCGGQRYWWGALADYWLNKPTSEARDDIVVRLASERNLSQSLKEIVKNPTTQLVSIRKRICTGKSVEMDAVCLKDLEQKPGNTLWEKAAASNRILSLNRTHSHATLENTIFIYVVDALIERAKVYLRENRRFKKSRRVQDVEKFQRFLEDIAAKTSHFNCLKHKPSLSVIPNNSLLYDRSYKEVWSIYRRLLLIDRATQDAWQYQQTLWKETGRQVFGSVLSSRLPHCKAMAASCAYIKRDMQEGRWTEHCSFPGPFQWHRYHLGVIDVWDSEPGAYGVKILESLKADQLLVGSRAGTIQKHIVVWYYHQPFEEGFDVPSLVQDYWGKLNAFPKTEKPGYGGLIIGSAPIGAPMVYFRYESVIFLTIPAEFSVDQEKMIQLVQQALETFLEEL